MIVVEPVDEELLIAKVVAALLPPNEAVMRTEPEAEESEVAVKLALLAPCRTVTLAGTVSEGLLLDMLTTMSPAALDMATVQGVLEPAASLAEWQVTEETAGVDHSVNVAA